MFFVVYILSMPTKKPQILLTIDEKLLERIEDYRFGNRIPTRTEAIRRLIEETLERYEMQEKEKTLT